MAGRPIKRGLDYFNIDCSLDDKIEFVEAKHGLIGYAIIVKLWTKIYKLEGYYCEWREKNMYLFCKDNGLELELVKEVVETCLNEGIFCQQMYEKHHILTSRGIQKRWLKVVTDAKRKDIEIDGKYSLIPNKQEEKPITPEEIELTPEENTQTTIPQKKEKENTKEETKPPYREGESAQARDPAPPEDLDEKPPSGKPKKKAASPAAHTGGAAPKPKTRELLFRESPWFDRTLFKSTLEGTDYEHADLDYYHEVLLNWSDSKGARKLDWLATAKNWMLSDHRDGKLKLKGTAPPRLNRHSPPVSQVETRLRTMQAVREGIQYNEKGQMI